MKYNYRTVHASRGRCQEIDGSPNFRSKMERNVYRYLRMIPGFVVEYEPHRYPFPQPYRRSIDYCPDFILFKKEEGILQIEKIFEVKGVMDGKSKTKLLGYKKYYPDHLKDLIVIGVGKEMELFVREKLGATFMHYMQVRNSAPHAE